MCGIFGVIGTREVSSILIDGLRKLEYRGYDSAGLATIQNSKNDQFGKLSVRKSKGKLINLSNSIKKKPIQGHLGIGHTRWATHGKPNEINAHPHVDFTGQIAAVQNGIIENHRDLSKSLQSKGIKFISETDTEIIPHLIGLEIENLLEKGQDANGQTLLKAVQKVLCLLEGIYAIAVIWSKAPDALVVARRQAPLVLGFGEGEFFCASDTPALVGFTRTFLPLKDHEIALLTPLGIELYDADGMRQHRAPSLLKGTELFADKRNFRHFMLKEIYEQPETAQLWIDRYLPMDLSSENSFPLPIDKSLVEKIEQIQILACGTSRHAGMVGAYLLEQFAGVPTKVYFASEFRYAPPPVSPNTLTIGISQSGETADTLAALRMEKERRNSFKDANFSFHQLGITNRLDSSLARELENVIDIGSGIEIGVAATKTFLGQMLSFYGLTLLFASNNHKRSSQEILALSNDLRLVPQQLTDLIKKHDALSKQIAHLFAETKDVIFLGRGINYPIALEGALKLKEISYIHAQGYPAGELKHGPIALLDQHVPVISIAVPGVVYEKVLSNSQEAKARDARLIGVAPCGPESEMFDELFSIPKVSEWVSPLLTVVPLQLFSYHIAAHKGLDVDQPRNLAKSVTVE
ncbi:glutamine--fructose-6-phosphate transaminase (isomerizing) [Prochlorococcus marinus]|uniref:Glutamine--fructose-6-phosphate aminotransferase [isomerizing] n=1 Tax=Prochlorococcus marinus XMU1408 TaxID=2213228 RepID=A0A318QWN1_PROMR|nr:glutamine--fructose-6-phosphate transaminase (isomerizing) [Prochlorococcus marinus]MBW3042832.1 glutamine--fructose-6-phosphate transaminase (isomerizing) [Prochlorococcus marinus str. XMU1408]PYE00659.1 glutamine--fructose-6-phosphate transaminase (isomerizing) [Prochlorococcus marinus XMU1408]